MKVKELKELLKNVPDDLEVYLQHDPEGNYYQSLDIIDTNRIYVDGDVYYTGWSADGACMKEDEWEEFKNQHKRCLVLVP